MNKPSLFVRIHSTSSFDSERSLIASKCPSFCCDEHSFKNSRAHSVCSDIEHKVASWRSYMKRGTL